MKSKDVKIDFHCWPACYSPCKVIRTGLWLKHRADTLKNVTGWGIHAYLWHGSSLSWHWFDILTSTSCSCHHLKNNISVRCPSEMLLITRVYQCLYCRNYSKRLFLHVYIHKCHSLKPCLLSGLVLSVLLLISYYWSLYLISKLYKFVKVYHIFWCHICDK